MRTDTLKLLACPACRGSLTLSDASTGPIRTGTLRCASCARDYAIEAGIPRFVQPKRLSGLNRRFSRIYDWFSWGYRAFSKIAFAYIGMKEETARREITDRLEPRGSPGSGTGRGSPGSSTGRGSPGSGTGNGGKVLEVSIGPGVNLPYLVGRPDVGGIFGLDISPGQLLRCQSYLRRQGWEAELFLGNGEQLPFRDNSFESVFHVGGINFFNDKKAAITEMIRVSKPGTRILICDETEQGARAYERFLPSFKRTVGTRREAIVAPVDLVPPEMRELQVLEVWKGWMYCLEFRKP